MITRLITYALAGTPGLALVCLTFASCSPSAERVAEEQRQYEQREREEAIFDMFALVHTDYRGVNGRADQRVWLDRFSGCYYVSDYSVNAITPLLRSDGTPDCEEDRVEITERKWRPER